ncbi:MAG: hypothetical protein ACWIPJ_00895 [Polaribacter sp.]
MKRIKIISIVIIILGFSECGSNKLIKNPPFTIEKAMYNYWTGGIPGVSGIRVKISVATAPEITFDSLFFHQKETKVEVLQDGETTLLIGHFSTSNRREKDFILDINATKEIQNKPPNIQKFPFELKENEAILSYKKDAKTYYFKIEELQKEKSPQYPRTKQIE